VPSGRLIPDFLLNHLTRFSDTSPDHWHDSAMIDDAPPREMTVEDVVRRIAAECGFVDDGAESSPSACWRRFASARFDPVNPTGDSLLA